MLQLQQVDSQLVLVTRPFALRCLGGTTRGRARDLVARSQLADRQYQRDQDKRAPTHRALTREAQSLLHPGD